MATPVMQKVVPAHMIMEEEAATSNPTVNAQPQINTYHCICSTLLLATTHSLTSLPRRAEPALDRAFILPLPPTSRLNADTAEEEDAETQHSDGSDVGYSLLLSTTQDRRPTVVRREDGFEKRLLLRCGRCRLVVGYKLDRAHSGRAEVVAGLGQGEGDAEMDLEKTAGNADGKVEVVYLLPGAMASSEYLKSGKTLEVVEWRELASKMV